MALTPNPNFPVITHATWADHTLPANFETINAQIAALTAAGKTDGTFDIPDPTPPYDTYRNWVDTASANAWIAFIQGLGDPNLTSIVIAP